RDGVSRNWQLRIHRPADELQPLTCTRVQGTVSGATVMRTLRREPSRAGRAADSPSPPVDRFTIQPRLGSVAGYSSQSKAWIGSPQRRGDCRLSVKDRVLALETIVSAGGGEENSPRRRNRLKKPKSLLVEVPIASGCG